MNRRPAVAAALFGLAGWGGLRALVAWIERNPDPFTREQLMAEPRGEETLIARPDGTQLRVLVAGQAAGGVRPRLHCQHLGWNFAWDKLVAKGFRVIAFDQRGHGGSTLGSDGIGSEPMADDVAAILRHFDIRDGVLVGHSMGGFVTVRAMIEQPDLGQRLRGLVLLATWAGRVLDGAPQNRVQIPLMQSGVLQVLARNRTVAVLLGAAQCGARPSPAMISVFVEGFRQHLADHGPLVPIVRAFSREDRYPRLGEIAVPTVVWSAPPIAPRRRVIRGGWPQAYPARGWSRCPMRATC